MLKNSKKPHQYYKLRFSGLEFFDASDRMDYEDQLQLYDGI
jgi:hypothetical protein